MVFNPIKRLSFSITITQNMFCVIAGELIVSTDYKVINVIWKGYTLLYDSMVPK